MPAQFSQENDRFDEEEKYHRDPHRQQTRIVLPAHRDFHNGRQIVKLKRQPSKK